MIDKKEEAKIVNGMIVPTDWQKLQNVYYGLARMSTIPNWTAILHSPSEIATVKNDLICMSQIISTEYPYFSNELLRLKDYLFIGYGVLDAQVYGQVMAIFKALINIIDSSSQNIWGLVHSQIVSVSKQLFLDGHYANAAEDAFIEINDRVKRIYKNINPETTKVPDGDAAMTTVFSVNNPLLKICNTSTESGQNEQKGFMFMLQGAMSALRNPKAHANIKITQDDAMRRIIFASMLMYKIDEAVAYSEIQE